MKFNRIITVSLLFITICACGKGQPTPKKDSAFKPDSAVTPVINPDKAAFDAASWNWTTEKSGIIRGYAQLEMFGSMQSISIVKYPESKFTTSLIYNKESNCVTVPVAARAENAYAAINASYFYTKTSGLNILWTASTTLYMNGRLIHTASSSESLNRSTGAVMFTEKGSIGFMRYSDNAVEAQKNNYKAIISSGPLLLLDGQKQMFANRDFNNLRHPRTMIGVTKDRTIYFVVVDGRFDGKGEGASIPEMAKIAEILGLTDAINLDGGGSSTIWTKEAGVINHPVDNSKWDHDGCRKVPTVIIVK